MQRLLRVFGAVIAILSSSTISLASSFPGTWTLWADASNGVPSLSGGTVSLGNAHLWIQNGNIYLAYFKGYLTNANSQAVVWVSSIANASFTPLPTTGQIIRTAYGLTVNDKDEPIVAGLNLDGNPVSPKVSRFDHLQQAWVPATLSGGSNPSRIVWPANLMNSITKAANGDIWAGGRWVGLYYSTDGGRSFFDVDRDYGTSASPNLNPTGWVADLAFDASGRLYTTSEATGLIYSDTPKQSNSWKSADPNFVKGSTPITTPGLIVGDLGNMYALGISNAGEVVMAGFASGASQSVWHFDPAALQTHPAIGIPDNEFFDQAGFGASHIVTAPNGQMFMMGYHFPDTAHVDSNTTDDTGGCYTSSDGGASWQEFNAGISFADYRVSASFFPTFESNGSAGGLAVDGNDVYVALANGRIYRYTTVPSDRIFSDAMGG